MTRYFIPWGDNYSSLFTSLPSIPAPFTYHSGFTKMVGLLLIESSCIYDFSNIELCKYDTNKLIGWGYGVYPYAHEKWSLRIGWRVNAGKLVLTLYARVNGTIVDTRIANPGRFKFDTAYYYELINDVANKKAIARVDGVEVSIPFNKKPTAGYTLKPYFGGDCSAPHDMFLQVDYTGS